MQLRKIFDISSVPANMNDFFNYFVHEFEKAVFGGGKGEVVMFFEDGPREGFSTTFKSVGNVYTIFFVQVKFAIVAAKVDVLMGMDFQNQGGFMSGMVKGMIDANRAIIEAGIAQHVEAAIKKSLRDHAR